MDGPSSARDNARAAEAALRAGDPVRARRLFEKAVAVDPLLGEAWFNLGMLLREVDEDNASVEAFHRYLDVTSETAATHAFRSFAEGLTGRSPEEPLAGSEAGHPVLLEVRRHGRLELIAVPNDSGSPPSEVVVSVDRFRNAPTWLEAHWWWTRDATLRSDVVLRCLQLVASGGDLDRAGACFTVLFRARGVATSAFAEEEGIDVSEFDELVEALELIGELPVDEAARFATLSAALDHFGAKRMVGLLAYLREFDDSPALTHLLAAARQQVARLQPAGLEARLRDAARAFDAAERAHDAQAATRTAKDLYRLRDETLPGASSRDLIERAILGMRSSYLFDPGAEELRDLVARAERQHLRAVLLQERVGAAIAAAHLAIRLFRASSDLEDLENARRMLDTTIRADAIDSAAYAALAVELGRLNRMRFSATGRFDDLARAEQALQFALNSGGLSDEESISAANNLAAVLLDRHEELVRLGADLTERQEALERAMGLTRQVLDATTQLGVRPDMFWPNRLRALLGAWREGGPVERMLWWTPSVLSTEPRPSPCSSWASLPSMCRRRCITRCPKVWLRACSTW